MADIFIRENQPSNIPPVIDMENAQRNCDEMIPNSHRLIDYNSEKRLLYYMFKSYDNRVYIFTTKLHMNSYTDDMLEYCVFR